MRGGDRLWLFPAEAGSCEWSSVGCQAMVAQTGGGSPSRQPSLHPSTHGIPSQTSVLCSPSISGSLPPPLLFLSPSSPTEAHGSPACCSPAPPCPQMPDKSGDRVRHHHSKPLERAVPAWLSWSRRYRPPRAPPGEKKSQRTSFQAVHKR